MNRQIVKYGNTKQKPKIRRKRKQIATTTKHNPNVKG